MERMTSTADEVSKLLTSEHQDIEGMIAKVRDNRGAARNSAFTALRRFLAVHEAAEETFVHALGEPDVARERVREEEAAGDVIARLEVMDSASEEFEGTFAEFAESVKTHAEAEEHNELPKLTRNASAEELGRIYDALQRVPEIAGQQGGLIQADADFASMLAAAKTEFARLSTQLT